MIILFTPKFDRIISNFIFQNTMPKYRYKEKKEYVKIIFDLDQRVSNKLNINGLRDLMTITNVKSNPICFDWI